MGDVKSICPLSGRPGRGDMEVFSYRFTNSGNVFVPVTRRELVTWAFRHAGLSGGGLLSYGFVSDTGTAPGH